MAGTTVVVYMKSRKMVFAPYKVVYQRDAEAPLETQENTVEV